jgi:hypothetical protein
MSQISKIYQDSHFRKEIHKDLTNQQTKAYLKPRKKKKKTGRKRIKQDHSACEMSVKPCGPHMGLYCAQHDVWIKWISKSDLDKLHKSGLLDK